jgi:hypothetical protein
MAICLLAGLIQEDEHRMNESAINKNFNLLRPTKCSHRKLDCLNYCVAGLMSRCSAGIVWDEQSKCKFSEQSTVSNRCMYYIEAIDGHCDCVEAQREMRLKDHQEE